MATTTDQKLTGAEVIREAMALGFTGFRARDEWWPLSVWPNLDDELRIYSIETVGLGTRISRITGYWWQIRQAQENA